jgi:acyl-CoA thioesterase-1
MMLLSLLMRSRDRFLRFALLATLLSAAGSPMAQQKPVLLVFGDSLSAGYGIRSQEAWPSLLADRLVRERRDYTVVNLSISGETTAGGRSRLPAALAKHRPAVVMLALGANDGLRGLPIKAMKDNLAGMIDAVRESGGRPMLVGMRMPPNYGPYADAFHEAFAQLSREKKVPLTPFLLEGIAGEARWFLPDGLHPTREAQPRLLDNVWPQLSPLLAGRS